MLANFGRDLATSRRVPAWPILQAWLHSATSSLVDTNQIDAPKSSDKTLVDRLRVTARAGNGGSGCVSFWGSPAKGKKQPVDGGNGGDGGSVVLRASSNMKSLAGVQQLYTAVNGQQGGKQRKHGRAGPDTVVLVPLGTVVWQLGGGSSSSSSGGRGGGAGGWSGDGALAEQAWAARAADRSRQGNEAADDAVLPDWLRQWRRPWVGAADYRSDSDSGGEEESEPNSSVEDLSGTAAASSCTGALHAAGPRGPDEEARLQLADLVEDGQEVVVARGGTGGLGNASMPRRARRGQAAAGADAAERHVDGHRGAPGQVRRLLLELKLLADVGLVGLPNAGKSSLLRALSGATPRVGSYPFTTLTPQLGVVTLDPQAFGEPPLPVHPEGSSAGGTCSSGPGGGEASGADAGAVSHGSATPADLEQAQQQQRLAWMDPGLTARRLVAADIPGLVAGAHANRGLGHRFLRHVERTRALAYVVDASGGSGAEGSHSLRPLEQLELLQRELRHFSPALLRLPALVVANKTDLLPRPGATLAALRRRSTLLVVGVSAREGRGLAALVAALDELVPQGWLP